jgi:hypothetical protein
MNPPRNLINAVQNVENSFKHESLSLRFGNLNTYVTVILSRHFIYKSLNPIFYHHCSMYHMHSTFCLM